MKFLLDIRGTLYKDKMDEFTNLNHVEDIIKFRNAKIAAAMNFMTLYFRSLLNVLKDAYMSFKENMNRDQNAENVDNTYMFSLAKKYGIGIWSSSYYDSALKEYVLPTKVITFHINDCCLASLKSFDWIY